MKIDLHVHAKERSKCSIASEKQHIESAIKYGLDAIVFTDHDKLTPVEHLRELNEKYEPFKIYGGIEIRLKDSGEDILVIGLHDKILEEKKWTYDELYKYVRENNGFIALAHPYRYIHEIKSNIEKWIPDAIEVHSTNIGKDDTKAITALANRLNCNLLGDSDAHEDKHIGIYYNELECNPKDEKELVKFLKEGKYKICNCKDRVEEFNKDKREREEIIKKLIKEGKNREDYHRITGNWEGDFDRVAMGKSYLI